MIEALSNTTISDATTHICDHPAGSRNLTTRRLLSCLVIAGPVFAAVAVIQILIRPGFDLTRQALSLLTLGSWGWVQSGNFILTGMLILAGAAGVQRALQGGAGGRWAPILLSICGIGFIGAGLFHPDPSSGFPPGTPAGASAVTSWHGILHMVCGSLAFLALIGLCFVLAHTFSRAEHRSWAITSRVAGAVCALGVVTAGAPGGTVALFVGVSLALLWVSFVAAHTNAGLSGSRSELGLVGNRLQTAARRIGRA